MALLKRIILFLIILLHSFNAYAIYRSDSEIKSAFLYKLLYFVEWPEAMNSGQINICVIGENPFKQVSGKLEKQKFKKQPIKLVETSIDKLKNTTCAITYISDSEKSNLNEILKSLSAYKTLTVSDINMFAKNGGMIGFANYNSSIKLEVNLKSLAKSNFKIDPNLLEVALNVFE